MEFEKAQLLTTGQAARLCSVKPDTIRKWIKGGRLKAMQTGGGHHRIDRRELAPFINAPQMPDTPLANGRECLPQPMRCWKYLSDHGTIREECKMCAVYHIRAAQCFAAAECGIGQAKQLCSNSCEECIYYRRVKGMVTNILVITADEDFIAQAKTCRDGKIELHIVRNAYEASAVIHMFRPAFVVVDQEMISRDGAGLLNSLNSDPRVPGMRIILAVPPGSSAMNNGRLNGIVDGFIEKALGTHQFTELIDRFPVELLEQESGQIKSDNKRK